VQVLFIGDLHQLSPVAQNREWKILCEHYTSPYFYDSLVVKEQMPLLIELNKIYRQKEDAFVDLLNKVRNNSMTNEDFNCLHDRIIPGFRPHKDEGYITLTTHNNQAELINNVQLQRLATAPFTYQAVIEKEFPEHLFPVDAELILKEGAQVMFMKNDSSNEKRYFNGKIGIIKSLEKEAIIVECDGTSIKIKPDSWDNSRYAINKSDGKLEQEVLGTFTQYPLRLAWAITIHKSQGLTFEKVMIDAAAAFSSGQVYVALSRCTSLEGIVLLSKIPATAIYNDVGVIKAQKRLVHNGSLEDRFITARLLFTQQVLEEIFSFSEVVHAARELQAGIASNREKLNVGCVEWYAPIHQNLINESQVGKKFINTLSVYLKDEPIIEKNFALQQRIADAAKHFLPRFMADVQKVKDHPLITEHLEAATDINDQLIKLFQSLNTSVAGLQYCQNPFSLTGFLKNKLQYVIFKANISCYAIGKFQKEASTDNDELYRLLKKWRDNICAQTGQPIYLIANQNTLKEISAMLPLTKTDLLRITGFGNAKVNKFGDEILDIVQEYCNRNELETNIHLSTTVKRERKPKPTGSKPDTKALSYSLYKQGLDINAIAKERSLTVNTIESHLAHFVQTGELEISAFVTEDRILKIKEAAAIHGVESSKILFENLPDGFKFAEIKMVLASMLREAQSGSATSKN
jgi:hypothetical protein